MLTLTGRSKETEPLVVKPRDACRLLCCGRTRLYELLASRELDSFLDGGSRKIVVASIHRYIKRKLTVFGAEAAKKPTLQPSQSASDRGGAGS